MTNGNNAAREAIKILGEEVQRSIIGQEAVVERLIIALLANGNVLVEGLPGLAKTRSIKSLARVLEAGLSRIQFTPDLLPSDITGTEVYYSADGKGEFRFQPGPIFNNLILADEINRAPAKVQAALLEAMEERQVTVAGKTYKLPDLFMVMATQNPIEQEGTYPLPEAQMDRFLMHVYIQYPEEACEREVIRLVRSGEGQKGGAQERKGEGYDLPAAHLRSQIPNLRDPRFRGRREIRHGPDHGHTRAQAIRRRLEEVGSHQGEPARGHRPRQVLPRPCLVAGQRLCDSR